MPSAYGVHYDRWAQMKQRCLNPNHPQFHDYGGRGITVCSEWLSYAGYAAYIETLGPRPAGHSLDRIDNDRGYEPGNVRWAPRSVQNANQRVRRHVVPSGASGYRGVKLHKPNGRFNARYRSKSLGYFDTPEEAARAYDAAALADLGDRATLNGVPVA